MTVHSRWTMHVPEQSLQAWVFGSSFGSISEKPLLLDADRPDTHYLSLSGFRLWSKRIALGLQEAGLRRGDRVLLFSGNNIFFPVVFMGILMAGGIFTGANPSFVARELAYQLKDSGATFMIAADSSLEIALDAAAQAGLPKNRVFSFDTTALDSLKGQARLGARHWTVLLASKDSAERYDWVEPTDPRNTTCCINYSSGTTGLPKGVEISHHAYIANGVGVIEVSNLAPDRAEKLERARQLCFLPMYHAYGQTYFTCICPKLGVPAYIMPQFDFIKMLEHVQEYRITTLTCVPPIVVALAKHPITRRFDLSSVEHVGSGAAPLSHEVSTEVTKLWPAGTLEVRQGWGMTEVTCTGMTWDPNHAYRSSAVGELMPNCSARLMKVDGSGEVTEANVRGELWLAGPTLMRGYHNKPQATADTIHTDPDGTRWMKTGDIAYVEMYGPGGLWHVVDRMKELIKVKGNQVAPAELEGVLLEHHAVVDAGVVGVTINGNEVPRAYIVPDPEAKTTEKDIAKWMQDKVVRYKWLKGGVAFVDEIPKNPSGKILRKVLRERAAKEVGDRRPAGAKLA